ncbi:hypothetical protein Tco_1383243 [Tanacetum coccineum]
MQNPEDILDPTTAIDMTLVLMAKAFTLNNTTPTNNNQRSSSKPSNMQIAQPGMNMDQDRHYDMVKDNGWNQFRTGMQCSMSESVVLECGQIQYGNGNVVTTPAEGNGNGTNGNPIRCYSCRGEGHYAKTKLHNKQGIGMMLILQNIYRLAHKDNLQQASTPGTQSDKAFVYDSDGSAEVHHSKNCYDNDIFNMFTQEEQYTELSIYRDTIPSTTE